jgi:O-antigen/teichoic acid export membrane protein
LAIAAAFSEIGALKFVALQLVMIATLAFSMALTAIDNAALSNRVHVARISTRNVLVGLFGAILQVAFGLLAPSPLGLALSLAIGRFVAVVVTRVGVSRGLRAALLSKNYKRTRIRDVISPGSTVNNITAASLGTLTSQLPLFVTQFALPAGASGQMALAQRAAGSPLALLGQGLMQSFLISASHAVRNRQPVLRQIYANLARKLIPLGALASALLAAVGLFGFGFIFGDQWRPAGQAVAILAPAFMFQLTASPFSGVFGLIGRSHLGRTIEIVKLVLVAFGCGLALLIDRDLLLVATFAAAAFLVGHVLTLFLALGETRRWDALTAATLGA